MSIDLPVTSMVFMGVSALVCAAIPVVLLIVFRKKGADILPFFIGCAVFIIFALVIEGAINFAFAQSSFGKKLMENVWFYAIYGGLMAGLFEETGRFAAFKTVLKKRNGNDMNALMYGAGHGGIEAILTVSMTYVSYVILMAINASGMLESMMTPEVSEQIMPVLNELTATPSATFLIAIIERCIAIAAHIAFSVLVWFGAKKKDRFFLYPLAILLHALMDGALVIIVKSFDLPTIAVEGILALIVIPMIVLAVVVWKKNREKAQSETAEEA